MRAGILAAGAGSRLRTEDAVLKPLRRVAGTPLIERVVEDLEHAGATDVHIIINAASTVVCDYLNHTKRSCTIRWIVETTPSSMHSFLRVMESLSQQAPEESFLISTVDVVAPRGTFERFRSRAADHRADVTLAATSRVDDDKPLLLAFDEQTHRVQSLGGSPSLAPKAAASDDTASTWATAGYYLVRASVLRERDAALAAGLSALRTFFGHLHASGYALTAVPMGDSVDVDSPPDILAAEALLAGSRV
jgi:NDP-sugar pyrophosphorylase family protein